MTAAKYSIRVHNYSPNNALVNEYAAGQLATYQTAIGVSLAGALAHDKIRDTAGRWESGLLPLNWGTNNHGSVFMDEAKALGMVTVGAWSPQASDGEPEPWEEDGYNDAGLMANFDTACALAASTYPNVDVWIFGNERETKGGDAGPGGDDEARYFALEARCGAIWQNTSGKQWMVGADQAPANFLASIEQREAAWAAAGVTPDWLSLHHYGDGGFVSRNVNDIRAAIEHRTGRTWNIAFTEWALSFENTSGYGTKDYVRDYRARDFNEHIGRALRRERVYGCYFNFKEIMDDHVDFPGFMPRQGIIDSLSDAAVHANPPSRSPTTAGLTTRRFLIEGAYANRDWNALWQGFKEQARSLVSYPGYWS